MVGWRRIEKFGGVVKIDDDHPLAVAEAEKHPDAPVWRSCPTAEDVAEAYPPKDEKPGRSKKDKGEAKE